MINITTSLSAWGNSHGIRISRELMQAMQISPGTAFEIQAVAPGTMTLRAVPTKLSLAQKLAAYDPVIHGGEIMAHAPVGAEFGAG